MKRLKLAIIDKDREYMESLADYIALNYGTSFSVYSFTDSDTFLNKTAEGHERYDVLLACSELFKNEMAKKSDTVISLAEDPGGEKESCPFIFKYSHCDSIVGKIMEIRTSQGYKDGILKGSIGKARVISIYSPVGGAGKSTVAAGLSVQCAKRGEKVFYLNLESPGSTESFFGKKEGPNMSRVILSFKYDRDACARAIMNTRALSYLDGLDYYIPPESSVEWDNASAEDYGFLIGSLRDSGLYNYIFVDLDSRIDNKNLAVLQKSDVILLLSEKGAVALEKINAFLREIRFMDPEKSSLIEPKLVLVENKKKGAEGPDLAAPAGIPFSKELENIKGHEYFLDESNAFTAALKEILYAHVLKDMEKEHKEPDDAEMRLV